MGMKLIMENWRSFQEGREAYDKYVDMTQDEKDRDAERDGKTPEEDNEESKLQKGDSYEYTSKKGKKSAVQIVDPENEHGATVAQKIDPKSCEPVKNTQFATNPEKFAAAAGEPIDKCNTDGGGDTEGISKGDSYEYTSKSGKESAVQVIDPENEHGATVAQKIDPDSCEPEKNTQFASNPEKFANAVGDPIDKCDAGSGGESQIAKVIAKKLASTGLDDYIKKITKRQDLYELEKVILNLALDSSSPIKADDLLRVVVDLKKDIEGKMKVSKDTK